MKLLDNNKVVISKSLFERIESFYSDIFMDPQTRSKDSVEVAFDDIKRVLKYIKDELRITNVDYARKVSNVSKKDLEDLISIYEHNLYKKSSNKVNGIDDYNLYDKIIDSGFDVIDEIKRITSTPSLINRIKRLLENIKSSDVKIPTVYLLDGREIKISDEESISKLKNKKYEDYKIIEKVISRVIDESYNGKLTDVTEILQAQDLRIIVYENKQTYMLTNENITDASYGLIMESKDNIIRASNKKNDDTILPFEKLSKKDNYISLNDFKPIARYAVTSGEKSLNDNYIKAQTYLYKYSNLPLIEIDATRYLSKNECSSFNHALINHLLDDKNIMVLNKNESLYDKFKTFIDEFNSLKSRRFDESSIRNLFDFHVKLLTSSEVCNLDKLLKNYSLGEVETVLKYNQFMDDNIFRYNEISKAMVERFVDKFYKYRLDESLNKIYPGFSIVLDHLKTLNDEEIKSFVERVDSNKKVDSWLIAQMIKPQHKKIEVVKEQENVPNFKVYKSEKLSQIENERMALMELYKSFLSSKDEDKNHGFTKTAAA